MATVPAWLPSARADFAPVGQWKSTINIKKAPSAAALGAFGYFVGEAKEPRKGHPQSKSENQITLDADYLLQVHGDPKSAYSGCVESPVVLFFGSTCVFPVSNQSIDLPNSRRLPKGLLHLVPDPAFLPTGAVRRGAALSRTVTGQRSDGTLRPGGLQYRNFRDQTMSTVWWALSHMH